MWFSYLLALGGSIILPLLLDPSWAFVNLFRRRWESEHNIHSRSFLPCQLYGLRYNILTTHTHHLTIGLHCRVSPRSPKQNRSNTCNIRRIETGNCKNTFQIVWAWAWGRPRGRWGRRTVLNGPRPPPWALGRPQRGLGGRACKEIQLN